MDQEFPPTDQFTTVNGGHLAFRACQALLRMKTNPEHLSESSPCPKCDKLSLIQHNGGLWCSICGEFVTPHVPTQTGDGARMTHGSPFLALGAQATRLTSLPKCGRCMQPVDTAAGVYDDDEWLCGFCISDFAEGQLRWGE